METDVREKLRAAAAELAATREKMRPLLEQEEALVAERDRLIVAAVEYGIRPDEVVADSGVSHSRFYQIRRRPKEQ